MFIHTRSHPSWRKMENDVKVTRMTLPTKQWRWHKSGAICPPLTAGNFLTIMRIRNGNILYCIPNKRHVSSDDFSCIYFGTASVSSVVSSLFQPRRQRKMAARCFLQVCHLAKKVLLWACFLNSMQYQRTFLNSMQHQRTFLNSMQYGNLLNVFFQCDLNGQFHG